ncbi:MAG TPA: hypothetical protein VM223_14300 [Planctomycetota bacterium]|nr:hypothetical protein [Planctomycetota bacterium]
MKHIAWTVLALSVLVCGCGREKPLSPEDQDALQQERLHGLYPGGMQSRLPAPRRFPGLEPGELAPISQRSSLEAAAMGIIIKVSGEIARLKPDYPELADFSDDCISDDGLALRYSRNVVKENDDTTLGGDRACQIVVEFSPIIDRGTSTTPWGAYTILYPKLGWQVCSYPAAYWLRTGSGDLKPGGRFVRAYDVRLCEAVNGVVQRNLAILNDMEAARAEPTGY